MTAHPRPPSPRARAAWRAWLDALAVDAEAALAAALTYEALDGHGRDVFLDAVDEDAREIETPRVALYAPLLAVEQDPARRLRLTRAIGEGELGSRRTEKRAFTADLASGERLTVLLLPLYLGFVEVLACRSAAHRGVVAVSHEPLRAAHEMLIDPSWEGVALTETDFDIAIESLAHDVLATRRSAGQAPDGLVRFADLFSLPAAHA